MLSLCHHYRHRHRRCLLLSLVGFLLFCVGINSFGFALVEGVLLFYGLTSLPPPSLFSFDGSIQQLFNLQQPPDDHKGSNRLRHRSSSSSRERTVNNRPADQQQQQSATAAAAAPSVVNLERPPAGPLSLRGPAVTDPRAQLFLLLGGHRDRELAGIRWFMRFRTSLFRSGAFVLLSSGALSRQECLNATGAAPDWLLADDGAVDTVTNFTTTIALLLNRTISSVVIGTSAAHLPRAVRIATVLLGANGIRFTSVPLAPLEQPGEPIWKSIRDVMRSLIWLLTGTDFRNLIKWWKSK